jgi:hypothetical protein
VLECFDRAYTGRLRETYKGNGVWCVFDTIDAIYCGVYTRCSNRFWEGGVENAKTRRGLRSAGSPRQGSLIFPSLLWLL